MTFINNLGMFLLGLRDSLYLGWIQKLLLCRDPQTLRIHPSSAQLFSTLKSATIRVLLFIFIIPFVLYSMGIHYITFMLHGLFLVLSYGYIFFYNEDILRTTRIIVNFRRRQLNQVNFELDVAQRIDPFLYVSGVIKGIVFLVCYYVPIVIITTILSLIIPYFGMFTVIVSEAFFNSAFFFLSTWPYDRYNAAFLQREKYYLLGFGMIVSIICNYFLSGFPSLGVCMIISLWMLINSVIYSPVQTEFTSFGQIWQVLTNTNARNGLRNAYNVHRQRLVTEQDYGRNLITETVFFVNPALKITQLLNVQIERFFARRRGQNATVPQQNPNRED